MRFEGKHKFLCHSQSFKNIALTLSVRHQKMVAFHVDTNSFFTASAEIDQVQSGMFPSSAENVQNYFHCRSGRQSQTVFTVWF